MSCPGGRFGFVSVPRVAPGEPSPQFRGGTTAKRPGGPNVETTWDRRFLRRVSREMSIQSEGDWKGLREAGHVAFLTLEALQRRVRGGISTAELDAVAAAVFSRHCARSAPALVYGFPGTVLISINDEVVHGVPGSRRLAPGDVSSWMSPSRRMATSPTRRAR